MNSFESDRWLVFRLGTSRFAVNIACVRELVPQKDVIMSRPPQVPWGVEGVAQVREQTIGVVELRALLGMKTMREETDSIIDMLKQRERDHLNWIAELESSVQEAREFTLAVDPHKCAFGKWYDALLADPTQLDNFTQGDLALIDVLDRFEFPHERIHEIAQEVSDLVAKGHADEAMAVIQRTRETHLHAMVELFSRCIDQYQSLRQSLLLVAECGDEVVGVMVDAVEEVAVLSPDTLESISEMTKCSPLVTGVAKGDDGTAMIQLLDLTKIPVLTRPEEAPLATCPT